ncbi:PKD-like family lipoprotein [Pedobacter steynii]
MEKKLFKNIEMNLRKLIGLIALSIISLSACHKDLGDYEINMPATPAVANLDSVYTAIVGDSLIIKPTIKNTNGDDIELQWRISVMTGNDVKFTGPSLKIIFGLEAQRYPARLTVYNKTNGMKYFHDFFVDGGTEFGSGTAVLSLENGTTQFSFIKPGGEVQARLYNAMHGKDLPKDPMNLFLMKNITAGGTLLGYWIITKGGGVRLNVNTMQEDPKYPNTIADNFLQLPTIWRLAN